MPKLIACVSTSRSARGAFVTITAPDWAHQKTATLAALAVSDWAKETPRGVTISKPAGSNIGGPCEVETVRHMMADARDAAKASLRANGYTVRAS
jgi:hypothetical protein